MTQSRLFALVSLLAAGLLATSTQAQQPQAPAAGAPPAAKPGGPYMDQPSDTPPDAGGPPAPVLFVTSVEVLHSDRAGGLDVIRARGVVTSGSWNQPHLLQITRGQPIDGMLDLIFQASAPTTASTLGPFMVVESILPVETGHPYKGVRVRGGSNVITLKSLPGYAEAAAPKEDCAKCLGKYFVAKGANPPAGVAADNIVREADLPYTLRVIKPSEGIASYVLDPNRLTLLLSEDGRIIDAAWD